MSGPLFAGPAPDTDPNYVEFTQFVKLRWLPQNPGQVQLVVKSADGTKTARAILNGTVRDVR